MLYKYVILKIEAGVAELRLARSEKMNALNLEMFEEIGKAIDLLADRQDVRCLIVSGDGRAFCAGIDIECLADTDLSARLGVTSNGYANLFQHIAWGLRTLPMPVLAAVHGYAFGAGLQLMLGADIRYVTPDAELSVMEIRWGIIPDVAGFALLREVVRGDVARELIYTGRRVSGQEALSMGLATHVVSVPLAEARSAARSIAEASPKAIRAAKRLLNLSAAADAKTILAAESAEQEVLLSSPEHAETLAAARQKRKPVFQ